MAYGMEGGMVSHFSVLFKHSTLDNNFNPWTGGAQSIIFGFSSPIIGSKYNFTNVALDVRHFYSLYHKHTIAGRILLDHSFGNPPFYYLPTINGMNILVGDIGLKDF